jgi:hypothetical protein
VKEQYAARVAPRFSWVTGDRASFAGERGVAFAENPLGGMGAPTSAGALAGGICFEVGTVVHATAQSAAGTNWANSTLGSMSKA